MFLKTITFAGAFALLGSSAIADCGISGGKVSILSNDFPAIQAVTAEAAKCAGNGVTVETNLTKDHKDIMVAALTANPSQYSSVIVSNSTLVTLMNDGLVRSLDDLVAKHGAGLNKSQLITVNGKVMAVAFMANAQHLFTRTDMLNKAGISDIPGTYEEVIAAAEAIRSAGLMEYPVALNTKAGWNLGEEFVNMYMGTGADLFNAGTAEVSINNDHGVATLNMLKSLVACLVPERDPDFTHTYEGPDDMPSHIKMALTRTVEVIPFVDGRLCLGTWQGVFLWEHRARPQPRRIVLSYQGV